MDLSQKKSIKECKNCGKVFTPSTNRAMYCGSACNKNASYKRQKERELLVPEDKRKRVCSGCGNVIVYKTISAMKVSGNNPCRRCWHNRRTSKHLISAGEYNNKCVVYYLPAEHYVGMTKELKHRLVSHERDGRNTKDWSVVSIHNNIRDAAVDEAKYHSMGYNGFAWESEDKLYRPLYD